MGRVATKKIDYGLYLVTDRTLAAPKTLTEVVSAAVAGGVTVVQLREKEASTREFLDLARGLLEILRPSGVPLIINDRLDVALAAGAAGVHLGQSDLPYQEARRILGQEAIIGLSLETPSQAQEAAEFDADYLAVSPVFPTPTKTDTAPPWGLPGLAALRRLTDRPLIAIGGINETNARDVILAGADGVAVVSAICAAENPQAAAQKLKAIVEKARAERQGRQP